MSVTFQKMHGLGNDFIVLDLRHQDCVIDGDIARSLSNRHTGIGCDQILILRQPSNDRHLASFEIWNTDGSRAEQCGNGVRCLGFYLQMLGETPDGQFELAGPAGVIRIECLDDDMVRVEMGQPVFDQQKVPVLLEPVDGWYPLHLDGKTYRLGAVSMGNPHALLVADDLDTIDVTQLGAAISSNPAFPQGCNAGFAEIIDRCNIRLRVFERGAAETNACGSGACAAMSILRRADLVDRTVNVTQNGGSLTITWTGGLDSVIMTGPATHVYEGKLHE
ncbi:MAG: diaminopimelate epimerase [Xanthomonadales bacterium]|nr:diaminopimelate epimerase [Xanthomonadales bacterium]MDH4019975.1 diaminopimelate epimerase [Xanthomonadales bacterium]